MIRIIPNPFYWLPKWFKGPTGLLIMTVILCQIESGLRDRYLPMEFAMEQMQLAREAVTLPSSSNNTGSGNSNNNSNGKLVYLTGILQSPSSITLTSENDPTGVVQVVPEEGVLKLTRTVQHYHWVSVSGAGTHCKARWFNPKLSCCECQEKWRHKNPKIIVNDHVFYASSLQLQLGTSNSDTTRNTTFTLDTPHQVLYDLTKHYYNRADKNMQALDVSEVTQSQGAGLGTPMTLPGWKQTSALYLGKGNYDHPEIGDAIMTYDILRPLAVSMIVRQQNDTHLVTNNDTIFVIQAGTVPLVDLVQTFDNPGARSAYKTFSNGIGWGRFLVYLIFAGCTVLTLEGWPVLQDWVPLKSPLQVLVVPGILLLTISGLFLQSYQTTKGYVCLGISALLAVELLLSTCRRSFSSARTGNGPEYNDLELSQTQTQSTSLEQDDAIEEENNGDDSSTAVV